MAKKENKVNNNNWLDSVVYWGAILALVVWATAGLIRFLEPVEPAISYPITVFVVSCTLYILHRNR